MGGEIIHHIFSLLKEMIKLPSKKPYLVNLGRKTYYTKPKPQYITYRKIDENENDSFKKSRKEAISKLLSQISKDSFELKIAKNTAKEFQQLNKIKNTLELLEDVILYTNPGFKKKHT